MFKSACIYALPPNFSDLNPENMIAKLEPSEFTPCSSQDMSKMGWLQKDGSALMLVVGHHFFLTFQQENKILPASVLRDALNEKIHELESEQHRKLKKTEKDALKDEILHTLLPRAFSRKKSIDVWIDAKSLRITIDTSSRKQAEHVLALLRKSLGSLPVVPLTMGNPIELTLTKWVRSGNLPAGFFLQDEAELKAVLEKGGVIRCKKQDLVTNEISAHINAGKFVTKLSLNWRDSVYFTLSKDAVISRIQFDDYILNKNIDIDEDPSVREQADMLLMAEEMSGLYEALISELGGIHQHEGDQ